MTRRWSSAGGAAPGFRSGTAAPANDLAEPVRTLEACLRNTRPRDLSAEEAQALQGLLQTVHQLTLPSLNGRG